MVKRGHEVNLEYSKKELINKMNSFFGYAVVEKVKLLSFDDSKNESLQKNEINRYVTNNEYQKKINTVKNEKIKKSLTELARLFRNK